jgi:hypothetical protein
MSYELSAVSPQLSATSGSGECYDTVHGIISPSSRTPILDHCVLRFTFYVLRLTFHALRLATCVSRITFHVSRFTEMQREGG